MKSMPVYAQLLTGFALINLVALLVLWISGVMPPGVEKTCPDDSPKATPKYTLIAYSYLGGVYFYYDSLKTTPDDYGCYYTFYEKGEWDGELYIPGGTMIYIRRYGKGRIK